MLARLGRAAERLGRRRVGPAGSPPARLGRGRLLPALAAALHRDRQPRRHRRPTSRSSASRRRPIRGCRAAAATLSPGSTTSTRNRFGQTDNYVTVVVELRRAVPALQRHAAQRQRPAAQRADVPGRHQHREDRDRQAATIRAQLPEIEPDQSLLPQRAGLASPASPVWPSYTIPKVDVLVSGDVPQRPGRVAGGQLVVSNAADRSRRSDGTCRRAPTQQRDGESPRARATCGATASTSSTSASPRSSGSAGRAPTSGSTSTTCSTRPRC